MRRLWDKDGPLLWFTAEFSGPETGEKVKPITFIPDENDDEEFVGKWYTEGSDEVNTPDSPLDPRQKIKTVMETKYPDQTVTVHKQTRTSE